MTDDAIRSGRRLLTVALGLFGGLVVGIAGWTAAQALRNPDVRTRRPRWLDEAAGYDVSFWLPLLVTVVVGGGLVVYVLARALRRIRAGEDLYARRVGRGVRRRGERHLEGEEDAGLSGSSEKPHAPNRSGRPGGR